LIVAIWRNHGQTQQARSAENNFNFILTEIEELSFAEVVDAYRAVYNPDNQQVMILRYAR
jgi:hypothetical protein